MISRISYISRWWMWLKRPLIETICNVRAINNFSVTVIAFASESHSIKLASVVHLILYWSHWLDCFDDCVSHALINCLVFFHKLSFRNARKSMEKCDCNIFQPWNNYMCIFTLKYCRCLLIHLTLKNNIRLFCLLYSNGWSMPHRTPL